MAAQKIRTHRILIVFACLLALSGCATQKEINPSIEYATALSSFIPTTNKSIDCKNQCEQAWSKCIKSTYVCDREGAACIDGCADHYWVPQKANTQKTTPTRAPSEAIPKAPETPSDAKTFPLKPDQEIQTIQPEQPITPSETKPPAANTPPSDKPALAPGLTDTPNPQTPP